MNKAEFLRLRKSRRTIIDMCFDIYAHDLAAVDNTWRIFKAEMRDMLENEIEEVLCDTDRNIRTKNWIRVRDLLLHMDHILRRKLEDACRIFQPWHVGIWDENIEILKRKNVELADRIADMTYSMRVEVKAGGTECCEIWIHERDIRYQLFSTKNPWLENRNRLEDNVAQQYKMIYQWGFNGGFLTGVLEEKYPMADICVFVSNLDIFRTVLQNICLADILDHGRLSLRYDPLGLEFAKAASVSAIKGNKASIVDRVEYRAFRRGEARISDGRLKECENTAKDINQDSNTFGEQIYSKIIDSIALK